MIPKTENEREILGRIQRLENSQFGGTKEMNYHKDTGRRDTGRTDEFSDETPQKDYDDYRKKYPKNEETARQEAKEISDGKTKNHFNGRDSFETLTQSITALRQTATSFRTKKWWNKYREVQIRLDRSNLNRTQILDLKTDLSNLVSGK